MEPTSTVIKKELVIPKQIIDHLHFINVAINEHSNQFAEIELEQMDNIAKSISYTCQYVRGNRSGKH